MAPSGDFGNRPVPDTTISLATDLGLVGQAHRQIKYHGGSTAYAEAAALNAYCLLHPEVPEVEATAAVTRIIKAAART